MKRTATLVKQTVKVCLLAGLAFLSWIEFQSQPTQLKSKFFDDVDRVHSLSKPK